MSRVLVVGGTGFLGRRVVSALTAAQCAVHVLSRTPPVKPSPGLDPRQCFAWDPAAKTMDPRALDGVDRVVFLAGANIAGARIDVARQAELRASRIDATRFLRAQLEQRGLMMDAYVSASACGFYGVGDRGDPLVEDVAPATDFSAQLCVDWEREAAACASVAKRVAVLRLPVVLGPEEGAYPKMALPARFGLAAALGSGQQWFAWAHVDDVTAAFVRAVSDHSMRGVYNVVAPHHVTNNEFTAALAHSHGFPHWLPNVPSWALNAALGGELASLLLGGTRVSSAKLAALGFQFRFPTLDAALAHLKQQ